MVPHPYLLQLGLWLLTGLVLISAVWVVWLRNLFRAALSLGLVLVGVAGLFVLLEAEFLAFVQILIYVGAILTLVVFAVMLTMRLHGVPETTRPHQVLPAAVVSLALFAVLLGFTQALSAPATPLPEAVSLQQLGRELITTLVLPFEVISLVFVAAMIGAIAVASSLSPTRDSARPPVSAS